MGKQKPMLFVFLASVCFSTGGLFIQPAPPAGGSGRREAGSPAGTEPAPNGAGNMTGAGG